LTADPEDLFEMANLRPKYTGLPMVIWVSERGRTQHGPRIKVSRVRGDKIDPHNTVTMTIEDNPQVIGEGISGKDLVVLRRFIRSNKHVLLSYWNREIDTGELFEKIKIDTRS
jgi:hypothetical protein